MKRGGCLGVVGATGRAEAVEGRAWSLTTVASRASSSRKEVRRLGATPEALAPRRRWPPEPGFGAGWQALESSVRRRRTWRGRNLWPSGRPRGGRLWIGGSPPGIPGQGPRPARRCQGPALSGVEGVRLLTTTPSPWACSSPFSRGRRVVRGCVSVGEGVWSMGVTSFQGCCLQLKGITSPGPFQNLDHLSTLHRSRMLSTHSAFRLPQSAFEFRISSPDTPTSHAP